MPMQVLEYWLSIVIVEQIIQTSSGYNQNETGTLICISNRFKVLLQDLFLTETCFLFGRSANILWYPEDYAWDTDITH